MWIVEQRDEDGSWNRIGKEASRTLAEDIAREAVQSDIKGTHFSPADTYFSTDIETRVLWEQPSRWKLNMWGDGPLGKTDSRTVWASYDEAIRNAQNLLRHLHPHVTAWMTFEISEETP